MTDTPQPYWQRHPESLPPETPGRSGISLPGFLRSEYARRPITDDLSRDDLVAEIDRLNRIIEHALARVLYYNPDLTDNQTLTMAQDLSQAGRRRDSGEYPDGYD